MTSTASTCASLSSASSGQNTIIPRSVRAPDLRLHPTMLIQRPSDALIKDIDLDKQATSTSLDRPGYRAFKNDPFFDD